MSEYTLGHIVSRHSLRHCMEVILKGSRAAIIILIQHCPVNGRQELNPIARNKWPASHAFG